jgi:hypothetical protein
MKEQSFSNLSYEEYVKKRVRSMSARGCGIFSEFEICLKTKLWYYSRIYTKFPDYKVVCLEFCDILVNPLQSIQLHFNTLSKMYLILSCVIYLTLYTYRSHLQKSLLFPKPMKTTKKNRVKRVSNIKSLLVYSFPIHKVFLFKNFINLF